MDTQTQPPRPNPSFSSPIIPQQRTRALVNGAAGAAAAGRIPPSLQAKMAALANRSQQANNATNKQNAVNETVEALMRATLADRPPLHPSGAAALSTPGLGGNPIMRMGQGGAGAGMAARRAKPGMKLSDMSGFGGAAETFGLRVGRPASPGPPPARRAPPQGELGTPFANFSKIVDPSGALNFNGKAILHAKGVDFSNGASFSISMNQFELEDELGKGNYGTVRKVIHKPTKVAMAMKVWSYFLSLFASLVLPCALKWAILPRPNLRIPSSTFAQRSNLMSFRSHIVPAGNSTGTRRSKTERDPYGT
ncbi:hypothetical protein FS842_007852 [Serendipita sp. 407]|nr:hypothetical protein FS842_007852 [Serendipita sp. 407]